MCLLGIGCASKHAGVVPPIDSRADDKGGPEAAADTVAAGAAEAGLSACGTVVTIYDSTSGAVPTCTFALPPRTIAPLTQLRSTSTVPSLAHMNRIVGF